MQQTTTDYRNKWKILIAVGMGTFLATIDSSIVNIALPTLIEELNTQFSTVQWVVMAYLLTISTLMLTVGRLADMKGKKPIYLTGFIVFTLGSLACGISPTISTLIASRILQALGASMTMALGMAIVTENFPPSERGKALGFSGTIVSIGIVVGPTLGGLILQHFSWHWIFFVNLPVGLLGVWMVQRYVPKDSPQGNQRFDFGGAFTLLVSVLSLLMALTQGQRLGFNHPTVYELSAIFIIFLTIFIIIEFKVAQPMIDLRLFRNRLLSINLITGFLTFLCNSGTFLLMPFFLENVKGLPPQQIGLMMAVVPIGIGIFAPISGALSDRFGTRPITFLGLCIAVGAYIGISTLSEDTTVLGYILRFLPMGIGLGIFQSPNNSAVMGTAPRNRMGVVSGMLAITRTMAQTSGVAIWGAYWAARTFIHAGGILPGGATTAPLTAQVLGLQNTFHTIIIVMTVAALLALWALIEERVLKTSVAIQPASFPDASKDKGG